MSSRKSHRVRRRWRITVHPKRTEVRRVDAQRRQEVARLRRLYAQTGESDYLRQAGILEEELDRRRPMPPRISKKR